MADSEEEEKEEEEQDDSDIDEDEEDDETPFYLVKVNLTGSSDPHISRTLALPPNLTFARLHNVIQIAFGWQDAHTHRFSISLSPSQKTLTGYEGDPNLRKQVLSLHGSHDPVGQIYRAISKPTPFVHEHDSQWTLQDVFEKRKNLRESVESDAEMEISYDYGFMTKFTHQIVLLGEADEAQVSKLVGSNDLHELICVDGEGHPCSDRCHSIEAWEALKEKAKKVRGFRKQTDWYDEYFPGKGAGPFDPYEWDTHDVNNELWKYYYLSCEERW